MRGYLRFLAAGLTLGLFTEFALKIVGGVNPKSFIAALLFYPLIVSAAYGASAALSRALKSVWKADLSHYLLSGTGGLAFEWTLLGNGPGSNAFQLGMFAMWTTFCFGPRILSRRDPQLELSRRRFWRFFAVAAALLTAVGLLVSDPKPRIVAIVLGLSAIYLALSLWLLGLAWRTRRGPDLKRP